MHDLVETVMLIGSLLLATSVSQNVKQLPDDGTVQAVFLAAPPHRERLFALIAEPHRIGSVMPPPSLVIIACRTETKQHDESKAAPDWRDLEWLIPAECMRVVETVTDAAPMVDPRLRQIVPNLADYGACAEISMTYAPTWEAAHRNWAIVKIGCPSRMVDANGRTVGWRMPECQGTLPGTSYPLRCRFDPSEI
ncbi:MAG: hypothetical protein FJX44_12545 [Alphaproteobacteria bacterium]|nr:hypothetical protein [Alphaproteobacteria bacterium]